MPPNLSLVNAKANRISASLPVTTTIVIEGVDTLIEDQLAIAQFTYHASRTAVDWAGAFLENLAKEIHRPHIDTGATFESISRTDAGLHEEGFGSFAVEIGPETLQARFLEWGFLHVSGKWIQYPFMMPATDIVEPLFVDLMTQIVEVAAFRRTVSGPFSDGVDQQLDSFRSKLYAFSKLAGDLRIVGVGGPGLSAARGFALNTAKITGDMESIMRNAIGTRITRRVTGRFASGTLRAQVSATISGPSSNFQSSATRIFNRVSGFAVGRGTGGI